MSKTEALKKLVKSLLGASAGTTYYRSAPDNVAFPYKTFEFSSVNIGDFDKDVLVMTVSIWDKSDAYKAIEEIADVLEAELNALNIPQDTILPTFYKEGRQYVDDPDKSIKRIDLKFQIQNYKRE